MHGYSLHLVLPKGGRDKGWIVEGVRGKEVKIGNNGQDEVRFMFFSKVYGTELSIVEYIVFHSLEMEIHYSQRAA